MSEGGSELEFSPADLVRRIEAGDRGAEEELVQRYGERLTFLLRRWTRDPAAAEDLYQETFRLVLVKIRDGELREKEKLAGFLHSLAQNLSTYHYRRDDRRSRHVEQGADTGQLSDPRPGSLGQLLQQERAELVRRVLAEMPVARDREILARYYLADQEKEEICAALALAEDHFKRVLFRARERYKELFTERHGDQN